MSLWEKTLFFSFSFFVVVVAGGSGGGADVNAARAVGVVYLA